MKISFLHLKKKEKKQKLEEKKERKEPNAIFSCTHANSKHGFTKGKKLE